MNAKDIVSEFIDKALSIPYPILIACLASIGFLLFSSNETADLLAINEFRDTNRFYLGPLFVLAAFLFVGRVTGSILTGIAGWSKRRREKREAIEEQARIDENRMLALKSLTPDEKGYLAPFIFDDQTIVNVGFEDGIMQTLIAKDIAYRASTLGSKLEGFEHGLQPWARELLQIHPELLDGARGRPRTPREKLYGEW
ncbi:MAG: super-infection exclusion protein B [Pseudomonadota bacterium]